MTKGQQMMAEAKAYASEFYDSESADLKTSEKIAETIADFCAGWKAADKHHKHHQWVPVEKRLPEKEEADQNVSVDVLVTDGERCYVSHYNFSLKMWRWHGNVTHWMPMPQPPRKEE